MISRFSAIFLLLALAACGAVQHDVVVEPRGAYATDVLVVAHRSLERAMPSALGTTLPCQVQATVDAREMGRAAANFGGVAPSRLRIDVTIDAECDGEVVSSAVTHEVPAGVTASDRRAALAEGVQVACRMAAHRLRADP